LLLSEAAASKANVGDLSPKGLGTHLVDARYSADDNYEQSVSGTAELIVGQPDFLVSATPVTVLLETQV
jgi:hypothetical protein